MPFNTATSPARIYSSHSRPQRHSSPRRHSSPHRRTALEREISLARGTDFKGADTKTVNIGTIVRLAAKDGVEQNVTVLGAWDSNPEEKEVSYLSDVGKALMGLSVGDDAKLRDTETEQMQTLTIKSISAYHA